MTTDKSPLDIMQKLLIKSITLGHDAIVHEIITNEFKTDLQPRHSALLDPCSDARMQSPLYFACMYSNRKSGDRIVQLLLHYMTDEQIQNDAGSNIVHALHCAARNNLCDVVKQIVTRCPDIVNKISVIYNLTPLHEAALEGNWEIFDILWDHASIAVRRISNDKGETAANIAKTVFLKQYRRDTFMERLFQNYQCSNIFPATQDHTGINNSGRALLARVEWHVQFISDEERLIWEERRAATGELTKANPPKCLRAILQHDHTTYDDGSSHIIYIIQYGDEDAEEKHK